MGHSNLPDYIAHFSYFGIFLWFLVIEQLTPVREEVSLMSLSYIAVHVGLNPFFCGLCALAGLLITDNLLFYLSLKGNKITRKILDKISPKIFDKFRENLGRRRNKTLFIAALLPKVRFFSPVIAASLKVSWKYFLIVDAIATLFYVTVYMIVGILFHNQLNYILHELELLQHISFILFMIALIILVSYAARKIRLTAGKKK